MPDRAEFDETHWAAYRNVNVKFATKTIEALTSLQQVTVPPGDISSPQPDLITGS